MGKTFLDSTTIHGFKYLSKEYHWIERIFWIISLIFSFICATLLIAELIIKVHYYPIVVYNSDHATPISEIDFPAITICTGMQTKLFDYREIWNKTESKHIMYHPHYFMYDYYAQGSELKLKLAIKDDEFMANRTYQDLLEQIDRKEVKVNELNMRILKRLQALDLITKKGVFQRLNFSVPTADIHYVLNEFGRYHFTAIGYSSVTIRWISQNARLNYILTEHGICMGFNFLPREDLFNEDLVSSDFFYTPFAITYSDIDYGKKVPRRVNAQFGLSVSITGTQKFYDTIYNGNRDGHYFYVHDSSELATTESQHIFVDKNVHMNIWIEPQLNTIDESLEELEPERRNCYLDHEKVLKLFKRYTKANCEHECLIDFMLKQCGCVEFFMIRNFTTRICSASEKNCFDIARDEFEKRKEFCGCLPPCYYIDYKVNLMPRNYLINSTEFNYSIKISCSSIEIQRENDSYFGNSCLAMFKFSKTAYNESIRIKQFNEIDFLSFVGGLLGLFIGFSALSLVEVIYWVGIKFLLKIFKAVCRNKVHPILIVEPIHSEKVTRKRQNLIREYLQESSIHGYSYISSEKFFDTIFWTFSFIFSISLCVTMISNTRNKLPDSRVLALDENIESIGSVPFPAVSFSPGYFVEANFSSYYLSLSRYFTNPMFQDKSFKAHEFLVNASKIIICYGQHHLLFRLPASTNSIIKGYLIKALKESSQADYFRQQIASFGDEFRPEFVENRVGTTLGITFNSRDSMKAFKLQNGNETLIKMISTRNLRSFPNNFEYPAKMDIKKNKLELTVKIKIHKDVYNKTLRACVNQKVFIHSPDFPSRYLNEDDSIYMVFGLILNVRVKTEIVRTDKELLKLSPQARDCYTDDEKSLKFFNFYTQKNCEIECILNFTLQECGCGGDYHSDTKNDGYEGCVDYYDGVCVNKAVSELATSDNFSIERNCSCLPTCNSVSYNIEYVTEVDQESGEMATVNVRMEKDDVVLYRRYQQFTISDIVSYVGGLLGLFAGISMLSIVEIFYFFLIRLVLDIYSIFKRQE